MPRARQRPLQVDLTSIRVHQHGTGAEKNGEQGLGRSRGGNASKVHLVDEGGGNVLGWQLTAGTARDAPQAAGLLAPWLAPAQEVVANAAYDSDGLRAAVAQAGATAAIKPNPRRKNKPHSIRWPTSSGITSNRQSIKSSNSGAWQRATTSWTEPLMPFSACS